MSHRKLYPWQTSLWQKLQEQIDNNRLPHALLLTGNEGVGKLTFAKQLACYLLCHSGGVDQAKNQSLFDSEAGHPDYYQLSPEGKMGIIKIDAVRELIRKLTESPLMGGYRVVVVASAHCMNLASANALLKTLEEPGEKVCIILVTSEPSQLLPTIKSRCQRYELSVDKGQGKAWLTEQLFDSSQVDLLWSLSGGAPLKALALSEGEWLDQRKVLLSAVVNRKDPVELAAKLYQKANKVLVLDCLMGLVVDLMRLKAGVQHIHSIDCVQQLLVFSENLTIAKLEKLYENYCQAKRDLEKQVALNEQLLLESWLIAWQIP